jgi:hypothetical protein
VFGSAGFPFCTVGAETSKPLLRNIYHDIFASKLADTSEKFSYLALLFCRSAL